MAEADGRHTVKDGIHFLIIARGSAREGAYWLKLARARKLIAESEASALLRQLDQAYAGLNGLIRYRRERGVFEERAIYDAQASPPPNTEYLIPSPPLPCQGEEIEQS